jgi:hypothetical protein
MCIGCCILLAEKISSGLLLASVILLSCPTLLHRSSPRHVNPHLHHVSSHPPNNHALPYFPLTMGRIDIQPPSLTRDAVTAAHTLIKPHIHLTPVLTNTTLSTLASTPQTADALNGTQWEGQDPAHPKIKLFFKCENFQKIGAFKVRGAFHAVKRLIEDVGLEEVRRKGVVTHSSGTSQSTPQV